MFSGEKMSAVQFLRSAGAGRDAPPGGAPAAGRARPAWPARYGLAVAAVAAATVLTWLIWHRIKPQVSPLYFVALLVAAWYGGLGPALVATALTGFLSIYLFSDPVFSVRVDVEDLLRVGVFLVVSVAVSALADGRRRAEAALRTAHDSLERRVSERTRELAGVNEALTREIGEKRAAQQTLVEHQARLQDLAAEVVLAEQRERRRIAERLHDELGQLLALSQIRVGALHEITDRSEIEKEIDEIEGLVEEAVSRTRSITCQLSPPVLYELGLPAVLEWLAEQLRRQTGAEVAVRVNGKLPALTEDVTVTLFHIARELLANVAKHARATRVTVLLGCGVREVSIIVEDDGAGFDPGDGREARGGARGDSASFGLFSIRERLKPHGGVLHLLTEPGAGTQVTATLPLRHGTGGGDQ